MCELQVDSLRVLVIRSTSICKQPQLRLSEFTIFYGEFDPGSGRTLAAWIRHASRATVFLRGYTERRTGE